MRRSACKLADLEMNVAQRAVTRGGQSLELTAREFDLLHYLFANQGRVVSREMLARDIWKETARQTPLDNVIDAQMVRLRRKARRAVRAKASAYGARGRFRAARRSES